MTGLRQDGVPRTLSDALADHRPTVYDGPDHYEVIRCRCGHRNHPSGWYAHLKVEVLEPLFAQLPASDAFDPDVLTQAMDYEREEALAILRKHGFVFDLDLLRPLDDLNEAERWQKLAFTFYSMLLPRAQRSERIVTEYNRLRARAGTAKEPADAE